MESVNPDLVSAIFIVLAALTTIVCMVINTWNNSKRKPSADTDIAELKAQQAQLKADLTAKQEIRVCDELVRRVEGSVNSLREQLIGSTKRHGEHEKKISTQIGDVHSRIDRLDIAVAANGGTMQTFIDEIRNWRNNHDQNNHS